MIKTIDLFPPLERHLLRLRRFECLEHHHALNLQTSGDVELFEVEMNFDESLFPYPFGSFGTHGVSCIAMTDQGREHLNELYETHGDRCESYSKKARSPHLFKSSDHILFTLQGALEMMNSGRRDQLIVFNTEPEEDDPFKGCDPDDEDA